MADLAHRDLPAIVPIAAAIGNDLIAQSLALGKRQRLSWLGWVPPYPSRVIAEGPSARLFAAGYGPIADSRTAGNRLQENDNFNRIAG
jgi:hypothetical protein